MLFLCVCVCVCVCESAIAAAIFPLWRKRARRLHRHRISRQLEGLDIDPHASFRAGWEWDLDVNRIPLV
jgi:hypothetical protein